MMRTTTLMLGLLLASTAPAAAHEVHHAVETAGAVAVRLSYADGKPFVFEAYEATPEGRDAPAQVGRTDDQGRALFVPGDAKRWRIKAFSADGHGVDLRIEVPAIAGTGSQAATPATDGPNRASLLLFGLSIVLSAFGIYQLRLRKRR